MPTKYVGRIAAATLVAVALASLSLTFPWFSVHSQDYSLVVYPEYVVRNDDAVQLVYGDDGALSSLMRGVTVSVWAWFVLSVLFLGSCMLDWRWMSIILGSLLIATCLFASGYFVLRIDESVSAEPWNLNVRGFRNDGIDAEGDYWSWGPRTGWSTIYIAAVIQMVAVFVRMMVAIMDISRDERPATD